MILGLNNVIDGAIFGASVCENLIIFCLNKNKLYLAKNSGVQNKLFFFLTAQTKQKNPAALTSNIILMFFKIIS